MDIFNNSQDYLNHSPGSLSQYALISFDTRHISWTQPDFFLYSWKRMLHLS